MEEEEVVGMFPTSPAILVVMAARADMEEEEEVAAAAENRRTAARAATMVPLIFWLVFDFKKIKTLL